MAPDLEFFFDVVCPFSWQTSRWVEEVRRQRPVEVRWRPVSLAMLNPDEDPDSPMGQLHRLGLRLQRVMMAAQEDAGSPAVGALYSALGAQIWEAHPPDEPGFEPVASWLVEDPPDVAEALREARLNDTMEAAQGQVGTRFDALLRANTDEMLTRAGGEVGTPALSFEPPDGRAFFGPVLSRPPEGPEAVELWEAVRLLGTLDGFAEFKTEHKGMPEVALLGNT